VIAVVLLVGLGRGLRRRRDAVLLVAPVVALGAGGYLALNAALALAGSG
jgi:hypothetical protein